MPYNSNEGYIYVAYNGSTNQVEGVDIRDIMQATGCGVPDIGYIIQNGSINPMAKYKPVRNSQLENLPLTYAQRRAAKHGLSTEIPRINTGTPNVSAPWQYLRPQGGTTSPYRYTDFAKDANPNIGYDARAVAPFAFGVVGPSIDKGSEGNGGVGFPLYVNSGVNTWLSQQGSYGLWHEDRSLSIAEIMDGRSFENAYIGFSIVDMTDSNHPHVDIVSNKKFTEISSSVETVSVVSQSKYVNQRWCPKVRLFADDRDGHTFRFIAFLHEGFSPPADGKTYSYYILRPNGSGDDVYSLAGSEYSLALSEGSDRYETVVYRRDTIRNLILTLNQSGLTMTNTGQTITYQGQTWRKYTLTGMVTGTITTPNNWTLDGIRVHVHFSSDYGFVSDTQEPPLPQYEKVTYISLPYANNTSTYNLLPAQLSTYVYIHSSVPANEAMAKIVAVARQPTDSTEEEIMFDGIYIVRP